MVDRTGTGGRRQEAGGRVQGPRPERTGRLPHVVGRFLQLRNRIQSYSIPEFRVWTFEPVTQCTICHWQIVHWVTIS